MLLAFQQAEEIGAGARQFVDSGLIDGVDEVFGLHVDPNVPLGKIEAIAARKMLPVIFLRLKLQG